MKLDKKHAILKKQSKKDDSFVDASPQERLGMIWDITAEIWSLKDSKSVKRRLQRNITNLYKK
ncbi:hypothetical protein ACFL57_01340 [Candidatus Margulisiibacteriota bacterium]